MGGVEGITALVIGIAQENISTQNRHTSGVEEKGVFKSSCRGDPLRLPWAGARPAPTNLF
jgi:hypothetical protein